MNRIFCNTSKQDPPKENYTRKIVSTWWNWGGKQCQVWHIIEDIAPRNPSVLLEEKRFNSCFQYSIGFPVLFKFICLFFISCGSYRLFWQPVYEIDFKPAWSGFGSVSVYCPRHLTDARATVHVMPIQHYRFTGLIVMIRYRCLKILLIIKTLILIICFYLNHINVTLFLIGICLPNSCSAVCLYCTLMHRNLSDELIYLIVIMLYLDCISLVSYHPCSWHIEYSRIHNEKEGVKGSIRLHLISEDLYGWMS